jgi:hypothetical protein
LGTTQQRMLKTDNPSETGPGNKKDQQIIVVNKINEEIQDT